MAVQLLGAFVLCIVLPQSILRHPQVGGFSHSISRAGKTGQLEPVLYGWLPNGKHKWFSDRRQSTVWKFDKPRRSKEHPTMKPIPLLAYPIKNSSAPNGVVMDLFGGSGSCLLYTSTAC